MSTTMANIHQLIDLLADEPMAYDSADSKAREEGRQTHGPSVQSSPAVTIGTRSYSVESLQMLNDELPPPNYEAATSPANHPATFTNRPITSGQRSFPNSQPDLQYSIPPGVDGRQWPFGNENNPFGPGFPFVQSVDPQEPRNTYPPQTGLPTGMLVNGQQGATANNMPSQRSMQDANFQQGYSDEETGLLRLDRQSRFRRSFGKNSRNCSKPGYCCSVILAIGVTLIILIIAFASRLGKSDDKNVIGTPGDGYQNFYPPSSPSYPQQPTNSHCKFDFYTKTHEFHFNTNNVYLEQDFSQRDILKETSLGGFVQIRPGKPDQEDPIVIYVAMATKTPFEIADINYERTDERLTIQWPRVASDESTSNRPCIDLFIWIDVKKGTTLDNLGLDLLALDIDIKDGLFPSQEVSSRSSDLIVQERTTFSTLSGKVRSEYWSSRNTEIHLGSGSLKGTFALRDGLHIYASSANIDINVDPKENGPEERPAEFTVDSLSNQVRVEFPVYKKLPNRDYVTDVKTASGLVTGDYILGSTTNFQSYSGEIKIGLLPLSHANTSHMLTTENISSDTHITFYTPVNGTENPWQNLYQTSYSTSSTIQMDYPPEWQGSMEAESLSGSVHLRGRRLEVRKKAGTIGEHFTAHRGTGDGYVHLSTQSGSIKVRAD